jgi:hypothetical protein
MAVGGFPLLQVNRNQGVASAAPRPVTFAIDSLNLLDLYLSRTYMAYMADAANGLKTTGAGTGAIASGGTSNPSQQVDGLYIFYETTAAINTSGGWRDVPAIGRSRFTNNVEFTVLFRTGPAIDNTRHFFGMKHGSGFFANAVDPDDACICFRFSPADGDTKWTPVISPTGFVWTYGTPMGPVVTPDTIYILRCGLDAAGTTAYFQVGSCAPSIAPVTVTLSAVQNLTGANLPGSTKTPNPVCQIINRIAATRGFHMRSAFQKFGGTYNLDGAFNQ